MIYSLLHDVLMFVILTLCCLEMFSLMTKYDCGMWV